MGPRNESLLTVLVLIVLCGLAIYRVVRWIVEAPRTADPWGSDIDESLNEGDAVPLCHHCLMPQEHNGWFCQECGATVGPYCNYLPYVYIFSQGELLRTGVTERLRRSPIIVIGYVLLSLGTFAIAAPIYWFFLFKNLMRQSGKVAPDVARFDG